MNLGVLKIDFAISQIGFVVLLFLPNFAFFCFLFMEPQILAMFAFVLPFSNWFLTLWCYANLL